MSSRTRVDAALVEELLYGSEGVDLDFKRDQYPFDGASDLEKAELLKDVLAFSNAFRRSDAFILIGVDEASGGRPKLVGVSQHLKDADLQQFVNTKTNRNVVFAYHAVEVEGRQIGVIRIEEQQKPIFLKKDFGFDPTRNRHRLTANVVYFRVGSSTKEASPEDIARMGSHTVRQPTYQMDLQFANVLDRTVAGTVLKTSHEFLIFDGKILNYTSEVASNSPFSIGFRPALTGQQDNPDFWREAYNYVLHWKSLAEIGFCIENRGDTTVDDVTVELPFAIDDRFLLIPEDAMPERPRPTSNWLYPRVPDVSVHKPDICVEKRGNQQVVMLGFGKVQAGERRFLSDSLYLGNPIEKHIAVDAVIRADQFPSPLVTRLEFQAQGIVKQAEWDDIEKVIVGEFFGADSEG